MGTPRDPWGFSGFSILQGHRLFLDYWVNGSDEFELEFSSLSRGMKVPSPAGAL